MITILLYDNPFKGGPPREFHADSIGDWLLRRYRTSGTDHRVFEGVVSAETEVTANARRLAECPAAVYVVLETPRFEPISWSVILANLAISTAISLVVRAMFAPDKATLDNRSQESSNNRLSDRTNRVRALERVEDVFGTVRAHPSLIAPTYSKYQQNRRVEYSLMCITRGYALIEDMRDGDTDLAAIDGASAAVYGPFTSPNSGHAPQLLVGDPISDHIPDVTRSSGVESIVLKALNQTQTTAGAVLSFSGPVGGDVISQTASFATSGRQPNFNAIANVGQDATYAAEGEVMHTQGDGPPVMMLLADAATKTFTVQDKLGFFRGVLDGSTITFAGFTLPGNNDPKTVVSHTADSVTVVETVEDEEDEGGFPVARPITAVTLTYSYAGTREIIEVGDGFIRLDGALEFTVEPAGLPCTVTIDNGLTDWTGWITLDKAGMTEVWVNVKSTQGMYKDNGGKSSTSVEYTLEVEQLDPDTLEPLGVVGSVNSTLEGATSLERAETLEYVQGWTGPSRVRMRRVTPFDYDFEGLVVDEITWADLMGVAPVTRTHFGNLTIVQTVTYSTPGAVAVQRRELSCLCSRLLPVFDGDAWSGGFDATGALAWGTIQPTSAIVDILAAVTQDPLIGGRPLEELDVEQVWGVQQALDAWHAEAGQFNYTFDRDDISYEDTVASIANAAFCRAYRQGGQLRLALDRPQENSVTLLTHGNTKPDTQTHTRRFSNDGEYDGVELVYMDPDSDTQETIRLPLDGSWTKLRKVEVSGIRSFAQAWFRAYRELQRLRFERVSQEVVALGGARALVPNALVEAADSTRFKSWAGEVVGQDGLELRLDGPVEFAEGEPHSIVLSRRDGGIMSIAVTPGSTAERVVLAAPPDEALVVLPDPEDGVRTTYHFASDSGHNAERWLIESVKPQDRGQYAALKMVNYAPEYYEGDALPVPPRDSVIN